MINKIIDAISNALGDEFGDGFEIYTESVEQGLQEPCFSIVCINPTNKLFLGNESKKRYYRQNQFCIHYFPPEVEDKNQDIWSVVERLYSCLDTIEVESDEPDQRGTQMHSEVSDGVLNFFVNYDMYVYVSTEADEMENLELSTDVKG